MKIVIYQVFVEYGEHNDDSTSHCVKEKRRVVGLPFLKIIREVMIHCHWCAGPLYSQ